MLRRHILFSTSPAIVPSPPTNLHRSYERFAMHGMAPFPPGPGLYPMPEGRSPEVGPVVVSGGGVATSVPVGTSAEGGVSGDGGMSVVTGTPLSVIGVSASRAVEGPGSVPQALTTRASVMAKSEMIVLMADSFVEACYFPSSEGAATTAIGRRCEGPKRCMSIIDLLQKELKQEKGGFVNGLWIRQET